MKSIGKEGVLNFFIVIIVFGLTGTTTVFLAKYIVDFFKVEPWTLGYVLLYIAFIFPLYQVLLILYATIFQRKELFLSRYKKGFAMLKKLFQHN